MRTAERPNGGTPERRHGRPLAFPIALVPLMLLSFPPLRSLPSVPPLPGTPHVLALARAPDSSLWVGTYGDGIFVLRPGSSLWEHIRPDTTATSISWGFVHAFAFTPDGAIWYGTLGNGWGRSDDGGRTWTNWTFDALGPEYQYVAPNGIALRGDTVYVATADGIKVTGDRGVTWVVVTDTVGARSAADSVLGVIGNQYVLSLAVGSDGALWLSHAGGLERSRDGGRTWRAWPFDRRIRAILPLGPDSVVLGTEDGIVAVEAGDTLSGQAVETAGPRAVVQQLARAPGGMVLAATDQGVLPVRAFPRPLYTAPDPRARMATSLLPAAGGLLVGTPVGLRQIPPGEPDAVPPARPASVAGSGEPRHTWFGRPVAVHDQPYIDQTYRYGSTMGGNFQQHQGVEFNGGEGTVTRAVGDGLVVLAGPAEAGALTVVIRHDRRLEAGGIPYVVFSAYYHHSALLVEPGERVRAGQPIGRIGNTGRATNDHLHLEVHAVPFDSVRLVVDPNERYPPFSTNPELWIQPLSGTGIVAGRVWTAAGERAMQVRVYGLVKGAPQETPFAFAETYGTRARGTPAYQEHFAVGDVPVGEYVLYVDIGDRRVARRVRVDPGRVTWVEFRP
jgi:murein DD-endopeptidase MepM/ murein hydrolase activator NlpD